MNEQSSTIFTAPETARLTQEFGAIYRGRDVLVTGADGFLGSHAVDALLALGANVHTIVRHRSDRTLRHLEHVRDDIKIHWCNLDDRHAVNEAVRPLASAAEEVFVFHFAAFSHVGYSWDLPQVAVDSNITGTLNLLQALKDFEVPLAAVDVCGTSEEYGNAHGVPAGGALGEVVLDEGSTVGPTSIYGTTKLCQDFIARNFHTAYGMPIKVIRMFNHFGPRQSPEFITGTVIRQALAGGEIRLGDLNPLRDFTFASDGIRAHLALAAHGVPGEVYTYGNGEAIAIRDWVNLILDLGREQGYWGQTTVVTDTSRIRPGDSEVRALKVDASKVKATVGWEPSVAWEEGLMRTIDYFVAHSGRVDTALAA